jgi:Fe-S-cluster containining protein
MIQHPEEILPLLAQKNIENIFFKKHLRNFSSEEIDAHIHRLNTEVSAQIDCTTCANCCKKLEPGLEPNELETLALQKNMPPDVFKQQYVAFDGEAQFLKTKPCMFLADCKCSIYAVRPAACAGYPHLDGKDMKYKRSLWSNYGVCPIVFNVLEALKSELQFTTKL